MLKLLLSFFVGFVLQTSWGQCGYDNTLHSTVAIPSCPGSVSANCVYGGQYISVALQAGMDYTFSTCNQASFDTQLTVYDAAGVNVLGYDDDFCGLQSQVTYTPQNNETVHVLLDQYNCQNSTACANMVVSCAAPLIFDSSNLPIIVINTDGVTIPNNVKIDASMGIIDNGPGIRNYLTDPFNEFDGAIGIEIRGSSSSGFPKKQWGIETRDPMGNPHDVSIFDMAYDNDWVLYAPYSDKSLMRNVLAYQFGWDLANYSPRTQLCEVVLNGAYQGVYVLVEKIKRKDGKVGINSVLPTDISGNELTGDYIVKIDKLTSGGIVAWNSSYPPFAGASQSIGYQFHDPEHGALNPTQKLYVQNFVTAFEDALAGANFTDPTLGYRAYIDVSSFIDFMLVNELTHNVDGYRLSSYFHKRRDSEGGKLFAGPLWDFNLALGNANYCNGGNTTGWEVDFYTFCSGDGWQNPFWWKRFAQDPAYIHALHCRWIEMRQGTWSTPNLMARIDSLAAYLDEAQQRNFQKWPILNSYVWPNNAVTGSYVGEIDYLKTWLSDRMDWIDANLPGSCADLGIKETEVSNFRIYPNPANSQLTVEHLQVSEGFTIAIKDSQGKILLEQKSSGLQFLNLDVSSLASGLYMYTIDCRDTKPQTGQFIKQ